MSLVLFLAIVGLCATGALLAEKLGRADQVRALVEERNASDRAAARERARADGLADDLIAADLAIDYLARRLAAVDPAAAPPTFAEAAARIAAVDLLTNEARR
ncbi:hypothetical protein GCM10022215_18330 [Nocardioides fonticola]|uniref:Uncharacterized protein n=1 Tax=Nocardioides fonticola TaxID=450363 RepID=A0ABP7XI39_9ACTN